MPGQVAQENRQQVHLTIQNVWQPPQEMSKALACSLVVIVQDHGGTGLVGAPVALYFGSSDGVLVAEAHSGADGQATFSLLPPGFYTVVAGLPDDQTAIRLAPVALLPGEQACRTVVALSRP